MARRINIGDKVVCCVSGVVGKILKFYTPNSCEEQTLIETLDGRKYHAPTRLFNKMTVLSTPGYTVPSEILTPYGQLVIRFSKSHGVTYEEALRHNICKARIQIFKEMGI